MMMLDSQINDPHLETNMPGCHLQFFQSSTPSERLVLATQVVITLPRQAEKVRKSHPEETVQAQTTLANTHGLSTCNTSTHSPQLYQPDRPLPPPPPSPTSTPHNALHTITHSPCTTSRHPTPWWNLQLGNHLSTASCGSRQLGHHHAGQPTPVKAVQMEH
jgi:hypothetical protein